MTDWREIPPKKSLALVKEWLETCVTCDLWLHGESSHYLRAVWLIILRRAMVLRQIASRYLSSINLIRRTQQMLLFEFSETCISWNDFASTDSDEEGKINYLWSQFSQNWHLDKKGGFFLYSEKKLVKFKSCSKEKHLCLILQRSNNYHLIHCTVQKIHVLLKYHWVKTLWFDT